MSVLGRLLEKRVRVNLRATETHEVYAVIGTLSEHDDVYLRLNDCIVITTSKRYADEQKEVFIPHNAISIIEEELKE